MFFEIGDKLTLEDNKKYIVVSMAEHKNKLWVYLVNEEGTLPLFCYLENDDLVEIDDTDTIRELLPLFIETASPIIEEFAYLLQENK